MTSFSADWSPHLYNWSMVTYYWSIGVPLLGHITLHTQAKGHRQTSYDWEWIATMTSLCLYCVADNCKGCDRLVTIWVWGQRSYLRLFCQHGIQVEHRRWKGVEISFVSPVRSIKSIITSPPFWRGRVPHQSCSSPSDYNYRGHLDFIESWPNQA